MTSAVLTYHNYAHALYRKVDDVTVRAAAWVMQHQKILMGLSFIILLIVVADMASAGTTATEFQSVYTKVKDWITGYLGKAIALMAFLIGLGVWVVKSSPLPAVAGVVFALFVAFGPAVIEGIATAVI